LFALRLPTGVKVNALWRAGISAATTNQVLINAVDEAGIAGGSLSAGGNGNVNGIIINTALVNPMGSGNTRTNTSAQIRAVASGANTSLVLSTYGWIDRRGRDQ
jgi:ribose/xylose/arabinose/galactoside ABC-type transport system permease subunit